jgi:hypothetical protein
MKSSNLPAARESWKRPGGLLQVQRQVHALMAAVLLWIAGLHPLDLDARSQPPH